MASGEGYLSIKMLFADILLPLFISGSNKTLAEDLLGSFCSRFTGLTFLLGRGGVTSAADFGTGGGGPDTLLFDDS